MPGCSNPLRRKCPSKNDHIRNNNTIRITAAPISVAIDATSATRATATKLRTISRAERNPRKPRAIRSSARNAAVLATVESADEVVATIGAAVKVVNPLLPKEPLRRHLPQSLIAMMHRKSARLIDEAAITSASAVQNLRLNNR